MEGIIINVYDDDDNVVKTVKAQFVEFKFGSIRSIMKLLDVENINDTAQLLKTIYEAWDQLIKILNKCFPEMEEDDWDNVKVTELVPAVVSILKHSFTKILALPNDSKN